MESPFPKLTDQYQSENISLARLVRTLDPRLSRAIPGVQQQGRGEVSLVVTCILGLRLVEIT